MTRTVFTTVLAAAIMLGQGVARAEPPKFQRDVAPLLAGRCLECHNDRERKGGLDLTTRRTALAGGDSGPALVPGDADESHLIQRIVLGEMPPESQGQSRSLPQDEIGILREWIASGAAWPADHELSIFETTSSSRAGRDWWSLQPVRRPAIPPVQNAAGIDNPIDAFVLGRLEENGMTMAPHASKRVLVRRLYFDLLGLPPKPRAVEQFVNDQRPDAWSRLVDQLLASPHYGERWARHWLDVVRFAETCGYERDQLKPELWRYRDWVIDALNLDLPYDQFLTHQLAGDEISDRNEASVIATGMLRAGTWNDEPNDPADYVYERLEDMVHATSSAFLGLTVKCARCHDHKFDPIAQTDYYRMASFFWAGYIGQANLGGPPPEALGYENVFGWTDKGSQVEPIRLLINGERHRPGEVVEPGFLSALPDLDQPLTPPPSDSRTTRRRLQLARWMTDPRNPLTPRVIVNRLWLHHFGQGIVRTPNNFGFKGEPPTHPQLLDWLAAELVQPSTASSSSPPTSATPWSLKRIHRCILTSAAYRQSSAHPRQAEYMGRDPQNRLWWHFPRRRLDAEALRDAMLAVSGQLDTTMAGPSFYPRMSAEALEGLSRKADAWQESDRRERARRSVYMMTKRSRLLPLMTTFDFCDTTRPSGQRDVTTVPTQALALMNNHFVHQCGEAMARRLADEAGGDVAARVERAWRLAWGRGPDQNELAAARRHLAEQQAHFQLRSKRPHQVGDDQRASIRPTDTEPLAWASLCHVLLCANEFIYVD